MPPVSHPFKKGSLVILMNYNDHAPPHVHIKYQNDVRSYRFEIRNKKMAETRQGSPAETGKNGGGMGHEEELLEQWENAMNNITVTIIG